MKRRPSGLLIPDPPKFIKGRWSDIRVFQSADDFARYKRGEQVLARCFDDFPNGITDAGIHYVLEVGFRSDDMTPVAQIAPWYASLIDNASFTGVAAGDTMSSHSGWVESVDYTESDRQTVAFGAAALRSIAASVSWTMNATKTIKGIFITSDDTKSGTTGTLFSTALFGTAPALTSGNVLTANYSLTD